MKTPLDDLFEEEKPLSIEAKEAARLRVIFEWIMSFSILFWTICLVIRFGNDLQIVLKGILLIGLTITFASAALSLLFAFFEYKNFSYYERFYHWWLILMSFINGFSILLSLFFIF